MTTPVLPNRARRIVYVRRKLLGMRRQFQLAEFLGVSRGAVSNWERDDYAHGVNAEALNKMAQAAGVSPQWIMTGEEAVSSAEAATAPKHSASRDNYRSPENRGIPDIQIAQVVDAAIEVAFLTSVGRLPTAEETALVAQSSRLLCEARRVLSRFERRADHRQIPRLAPDCTDGSEVERV